MRATDRFGKPFTPPGFYYKTFIRPRRLWPLYEKVLRNAAGLGRLARRQAEREWRTEYRRRHADVLVIGGGVAGLRPRCERPSSAPTWCWPTTAPSSAARCSPATAPGARRELARPVRAAGVEVLAPAAALGYFDGIVPVWSQSTLHQVRADRHVAATGSIEQPLMFEGNDLPGVMLCSGAERLASLYGVAPGEQGGGRDHGDPRARVGARAGRGGRVEVAAVADARREGPAEELVARLERARDPAAARPRRGPRPRPPAGARARWSPTSTTPGAGSPTTSAGIECDLVAVSGGTVPGDLAAAAGRREGPLGRGPRRLPARGRPARDLRRRRGRRPRLGRARRALGRGRRRRGRALARARRRRRPRAARAPSASALSAARGPRPSWSRRRRPAPRAGTASASPASART